MMKNKWEDCVYLKDHDIINYYGEKKGRILYFMCMGFDPRMCESLILILKANPYLDILLLEYDEGSHSSSHVYREYIETNIKKVKSLGKKISEITIDVHLSHLPIFFKRTFSVDFFKEYERIIIDVSAMPQTISFNLIKHIDSICNNKFKLDIVTCENSTFDDAIIPTGLSETANYLNGFNIFSMEMESEDDSITVWLPLLGKNCNDELDKIHSYISPKEICPVLPFPSENPKRSDEILQVVGELLFSSFLVEKKNILYVAENNIIQVYKKLCNTIEYYNEALSIIGKTKFIFSVSSSKLIGIGALLASINISNDGISTSFAMVENEGYLFDAAQYNSAKNSFYCLCLKDSIYEW